MLKLLVNHVARRLQWRRQARLLDAMASMEEFHAYVQRERPEAFLSYQGKSADKRREFEDVIRHLGLDVRGKTFLDLGPAYGDSLDLCHEWGAAQVAFVDFEPFFYTYNRLKGFTTGWRINHMSQLARLAPRRFDVIWCRGGVTADWFIRFSPLLRINRWLRTVDRLAAPGGAIVICPFWQHSEGRRRVEDFRHNLFHYAMIEHGYAALEPIPRHNAEPAFPVTFLKRT